MLVPSPPFLYLLIPLVTDWVGPSDHGDAWTAQSQAGMEQWEPNCCWQRNSQPSCACSSAPPPREPPPQGTCVPPWQSVHQANSLAPFLHLPVVPGIQPCTLMAPVIRGLANTHTPGLLKAQESWPRAERHQGQFQKQKGSRIVVRHFFKTCIYLVNNVC